MSELIDKAIKFATTAHRGQLRDGTDIPYILHTLEAAMIVAGIKEDEELMAAAVLHDTLEDTKITVVDLKNNFPSRVVTLVIGDTEDKRSDLPAELTWDARKRETINYIGTRASLDEKIVCLGDKLSNIRSIHRDYLKIGDDFWKRFAGPMPKQAWYYRELVKCFECLKETEAYKEFVWLVEDTFKSV